MNPIAVIANHFKNNRHIWYFAALHIGICLIFTIVVLVYNTQIGGFDRSAAKLVLEGQLPYIDFPVEYPPPVTLVMCFPSLIAESYTGYAWVFAGEMMILDIILLFVLARAARLLGRSILSTLILYTVAVILLGPIVINRHDLLPALMTTAALTMFIDKRTTIGWGLLGLAAATKLYPAFLAPLFFIYQITRREDTALIKGILAFTAVIVAVYLPVYLINHDAFSYLISYHLNRGLHADSVGGVFLLLADLAGLTTVGAGFSYGSWNLISPAADTFAAISTYITVLLAFAIYILYISKVNKPKRPGLQSAAYPAQERRLVYYCLLTIIVVIISGKVFSPQYLTWLLPLVAVTLPDKKVSLGLFLTAALLTQINFPYMYIAFSQKEAAAVIVLGLRNILLISMAVVMALYVIRRNKAVNSDSPVT